jgi:hypothetical protein
VHLAEKIPLLKPLIHGEDYRANAALSGLKNGFSEVFKRNQYANRLDEKGLTDILVSVTGLPKNDKVVRAIVATFQILQGFASQAKDEPSTTTANEAEDTRINESQAKKSEPVPQIPSTSKIGLVYNINIVLPESTNVEVYNAIFKSVRANLLQ